MSSQAVVGAGGLSLRVHSDGRAVTGVDLLPLGSRAQAGPAPKDPVLRKAVAQLGQYLAGKRRRFSLPLAQPGTPFQQAVWKALLTVPHGQWVTYGELAAMAGRPRAARAVGSAMNRNRLPILVPCHRVVASDGLGGYGYGLEWKQRLMALERP